jgi:DNA-binding transcriptional regulator YdaS (Cro superfamily)
MAGGHGALGRLVGVSGSAVSQWERVPIDKAIAVARATHTPVSRIRPDIWGDEALQDALSAHLLAA